MSNLVEVSANLGEYLTSLSPQVKNGSLQYYISGSLATMIIASAESITEIELDESNNIIGESNTKSITEEQRSKLEKFSRKLGYDIDVVNVNGDLFFGSPVDNKPHIQNVIQNVPKVLELMSWSPQMGGSMYIDNLESEREITSHPVAKVKTQNGEIYVIAPPEQLAHKLYETMWLSSSLVAGKASDIQKSKYEKDIRDLSSMFYGFKDLYGEDEFSNRIYLVLNQIDEAFFSKHIMRRIIEDSAIYLDNIADDKSSVEISDFLSNLINRKRLQQREAELSALEAEAKKYDEEEALRKQMQQEGQDIGEK